MWGSLALIILEDLQAKAKILECLLYKNGNTAECMCYGIIQIVQNMPNNIILALCCKKMAIVKGIVHPKMNIVIIYSRVTSKLGGLCSSVKHKRRYVEECCGLSHWLSLFLAIDILFSANCSKLLQYWLVMHRSWFFVADSDTDFFRANWPIPIPIPIFFPLSNQQEIMKDSNTNKVVI